MGVDFPNGFYLSKPPRHYKNFGKDSALKTGDAFRGKDQSFSKGYAFEAFAMNRRLPVACRNVSELIRNVCLRDFSFPGCETSTAESIVDLCLDTQLVEFDFSRRYKSPAPEELKPYLECMARDKFSDIISPNLTFKLVSAEADLDSVKVSFLGDFARFTFDDRSFLIKKLGIRFKSEGTAKYVCSTHFDPGEASPCSVLNASRE